MSVQTEHFQYKARANLRRRIRDCLSGTDRIKSRGITYLPLPDPTCNDASDQRYCAYKERAYYVNMPARTVRAFSGLVMRKDPAIELIPRLEYMLDDADGNGTSLEQMIANGLDECESLGNFGLLAKQPLTDGMNKANENQFMPKLALYKEEQIINWRVTDGKLSMVVLLEVDELPKESDMFETAIVASYRVYYFDDSGALVEDFYKGSQKDAIITGFYADDYYSGQLNVGDNWEVTQTVFRERNRIPFIFCGSINNEPGFDPSPIENICDFSLKMYMVSADEMLNVHNASGGVLTISSGLDKDSWTEYNGSTNINVNFGAVHLGENGSMQYVQAEESKLIGSTMDRLMNLAIAQGAQIITPTNQDKTATEARIDQGANLSQLGQIAQNIGQAFTWILNMCSLMVNQPEENKVELNNEFFFERLTAEEMRAWAELVMKGYATQTDMNADMRRGGRISDSRTDEEIQEELAEQGLVGAQGVTAGFDNRQ